MGSAFALSETAIVCGRSRAAAMKLDKRYPWIVEATLKNRQERFVLDGEAVILGVATASPISMRNTQVSPRAPTRLSCTRVIGIPFRDFAEPRKSFRGECFKPRGVNMCSGEIARRRKQEA
jgi:hypothetical protein